MTEKEIITEIDRYLADTSYNYAVMIDGDWGCGKHNLKDDPNGNVFASVDSKIWIGLLKKASPEVITKFRHWFHWVYPTNLIRQNRQCDIDVLEEIAIAIDPEDANDLIVKNLQKWLKNDIEKVCALYNHTKQKTTIEAKDESNG